MTQLTPIPGPPPSTRAFLPLRLITHNIRFSASGDERLPNEFPWRYRRPYLFSQLNFLTQVPRSLICLQEVLTVQINDLSTALGSEWAWVGVGRDDGVDAGERCVILYRKLSWREVSFETHWLNEDGQVGEKGWDAGSVRVVSCLVLEAVTGRPEDGRGRVLVMNTHLDNAGVVARRESARVILNIAERLVKEYDVDFHLVMGDLNSEENGDAYKIMNGEQSGVRDTLKCIPEDEKERRWYGEHYTYTGFDGKGDKDGLQRIDFVFVQHDGAQSGMNSEVKSYAVLPNGWQDLFEGKMSDHRVVCVDVLLSK